MQGSRGPPSGAFVITLVACLVVLGALGYAYSSVSVSLSAEQSSLSSLGGEVQSLQSHASQAQTSPEVTLTTELTTTTTTTTMDQNMAPRASAGAGSLGTAVLFILGAAPRSVPRPRSAARFGKTVLSDAPA
jgi:hypothetical protein